VRNGVSVLCRDECGLGGLDLCVGHQICIARGGRVRMYARSAHGAWLVGVEARGQVGCALRKTTLQQSDAVLAGTDESGAKPV
jgi:hypothetical protein